MNSCHPSKCCYLPILSMPIRCECRCRMERHCMYWLTDSSIYYFSKCPTRVPAASCHFRGSLSLHHLLLRPEAECSSKYWSEDYMFPPRSRHCHTLPHTRGRARRGAPGGGGR